MDWFSSEGELGKPVGQDLRRGLITLPLIKALKLSNKKEEIQKIIDRRKFSSEEMDFIRKKIVQSGALAFSKKTAELYLSRAVKLLSSLPDIEARSHLKNIAENMLEQ
ncbi:MAG: Heptaprenyl diphosphate synthase component II [Clostridia bacterium 41_269]|nr:MAG: Heptaprenyl diphosphate synthase component II [Clostridia bacterium 41_269]